MLQHHGRRNAAALPVVHSLLKSGGFSDAQQPGKGCITTYGFDEVSGFFGIHASDSKQLVYAMSNVLCTTHVNGSFRLPAMPSRPIDKVLEEQKARDLNDTETAAALGVTKQVFTNWKSRGVPPKEYRRVAHFCRMTVDEMLGNGRPPPLAVRDADRTSMHGRMVTAEELDFAIEWGKLNEPQRTAIRTQVMLLVAEQIRQQRQSKKDAKEIGPGQGRQS